MLSIITALAFCLLLPSIPEQGRPSSILILHRQVVAHLRNPLLLALYSAAFLLMGAFVSIYNYLTFRLEAEPYSLPVALVSLLFCAYLLGTFSSAAAGKLASCSTTSTVFLSAISLMSIGILLTLATPLTVIITGLSLLTTGFFSAHSLAPAWVSTIAIEGRTQATALYNVFYYAGSAFVGWLLGTVYSAHGWTPVAALCITYAALSGAFVYRAYRTTL